jgi:hypothetical protein
MHLLGFLEALLVALREFFACVGKPKKIARVSFRRNDMLVTKTVRSERHGYSRNVHLPVGVEMHDEFVPVPTNLFGEVREVGFHHFQANKKAGLKGSGISDDVPLEMFVLFVA